MVNELIKSVKETQEALLIALYEENKHLIETRLKASELIPTSEPEIISLVDSKVYKQRRVHIKDGKDFMVLILDTTLQPIGYHIAGLPFYIRKVKGDN